MKAKMYIFAALFLTGSVFADEVDESSVTSFTDGTPAVAGEVNANFQALIDAINDNASRIAALESSSSSDSNSVSGATFRLNQIGNILTGGPGGNDVSVITGMVQSYTVVFSADGSLSLSGAEYEADLEAQSGNFSINSNGDPVSESGTWTQSGSTLSTNLGVDFYVSGDGNVIIANEFSTDTDSTGDRADTSFLVGVRTN